MSAKRSIETTSETDQLLSLEDKLKEAEKKPKEVCVFWLIDEIRKKTKENNDLISECERLKDLYEFRGKMIKELESIRFAVYDAWRSYRNLDK